MISRKRILGFAIGKMLRQDGWAEKYNSKNQFNVNQYDYSTCKEYVNVLKEKWQVHMTGKWCACSAPSVYL